MNNEIENQLEYKIGDKCLYRDNEVVIVGIANNFDDEELEGRYIVKHLSPAYNQGWNDFDDGDAENYTIDKFLVEEEIENEYGNEYNYADEEELTLIESKEFNFDTI